MSASAPSPRAPFRIAAFRWQWPADLSTAWAFEMETLILGWYVLVESGSVVMLTLFGALMYVGTLLSPLIGTLGDRTGLHRLLTAMRGAYAVLAAALLLMAALGQLSPPFVLGVAFLVGLVKPSDIGMRTALVSATVPASHLVAAVGVSRTTQDSARIGGALAGAGFMASLGMVSAYVLITALYLLAAALTWRAGRTTDATTTAHTSPAAPAPSLPHAPPATPAQDLKEGLRHVWRTPRLRAAVTLAALVNLCAFPLSGGLMPYIARDVFGLDSSGLGWLVASWASGALLGSLAMGAMGARLPPGRAMLVSCALWYGCLLALALPIGAGTAMAVYLACGLFQSLGMVALSIILLRTCEERFRGRVMGVRMLAIYTLPIGLLVAGALIPHIGFAMLVLAYAGLGLGALGALAWAWRAELWPLQARANAV